MLYTSISPQDLLRRTTHAGSGQYDTHIFNPPMHPGATRADMPRFYMLLDQRRTERVPRPPHLSPAHETFPAVTFSAHGWPGVRVRDVLKGTAVVDSPNDFVFAELGWRSTMVNLEWPGYDPNTIGKPMLQRINVRPDGGRYMTRQEFAREICELLLDFHKRISRYAIATGWEKWALTTGSEGIRVSDVVLLSVHYYRTVWVPELYVIE